MKKAVFLDRDGVLNEVLTKRVKFVNTPKQLFMLEGAADAVAELTKAGYPVFIVTNQGGIGLGFMTEHKLQKVHQRLIELIKEKGGMITDIAYCPHKPTEGCLCRKPKPGMLEHLAKKHQLDLPGSVMVGDHERDIESGKAAGCKTVFIGEGETTADESAPTLYSAIQPILDLLKKDA
ncbi:D-glycero-beta-D-manno-heptose-1,7-bisphosphate 7-phosphatase [Bacillus sp. FJAT-27225]|uniref:D-glycero-alpha-D-manno-heptose-1,7-bisphosphate 7-phosphatase n=1 Tax=Bacillus sp. FJAT-27225 TaxID=1743144 RepID=UPI00080C219B|nr:HAD family hydrolase [Bacillus sp. FJAT-27225]OCA90762.1 D-glycero-beta-D-manno-heptose-1,7-bisphosphate 7-phosphatase [Bacillus sp. FJAT-27225]